MDYFLAFDSYFVRSTFSACILPPRLCTQQGRSPCLLGKKNVDQGMNAALPAEDTDKVVDRMCSLFPDSTEGMHSVQYSSVSHVHYFNLLYNNNHMAMCSKDAIPSSEIHTALQFSYTGGCSRPRSMITFEMTTAIGQFITANTDPNVYSNCELPFSVATHFHPISGVDWPVHWIAGVCLTTPFWLTFPKSSITPRAAEEAMIAFLFTEY